MRALITIDGFDGSGKSTIAARLAAGLGAEAARLMVDDFRRPVDWSSGEELDLYYRERYDLATLEAAVTGFLDGAADCRFPFFDEVREVLDGERRVSFGSARWLIVEGVFVGRLRSSAGAYSIWVDIDEPEARRRLKLRDLAKGRTETEVERRVARRYVPAHHRYLAETQARERARLLVENADPRAPRILAGELPVDPSWGRVREVLRLMLNR
jgi:uridine kinase